MASCPIMAVKGNDRPGGDRLMDGMIKRDNKVFFLYYPMKASSFEASSSLDGAELQQNR